MTAAKKVDIGIDLGENDEDEQIVDIEFVVSAKSLTLSSLNQEKLPADVSPKKEPSDNKKIDKLEEDLNKIIKAAYQKSPELRPYFLKMKQLIKVFREDK